MNPSLITAETDMPAALHEQETPPLSAIESGQMVIVCRPRYASFAILKAIRITATQIICEGRHPNNSAYECKFNRETGYEVGGTPGLRSSLMYPTVARMAFVRLRINAARIAHKLSDVQWRKIPAESLEQIATLLNLK